MAIQGAIPLGQDLVFPHGAFVVGEVERLEDFDRKQAGEVDTQSRDKVTGERLWAVRVVDADPESRRGQAEVVVKIAAEHQPVPPAEIPGLPFRPVVFQNLTATPWIDTNRTRPRLAWSLKATGMTAPGAAGKAGGKVDEGRAA
ncbi:hypothetical protein CLV92_114113 [Kineococcus xinjiangensis]|uniref:Plasmid replication, integration and excision activator n=1 Tax=Kineococcus xinjiangensis TaxID=512762 RepID=A0A2S6IE70_9ACTN|nr:plasmid replication, integration and excision activator [Kineococcus xinjiangensis]PPK92512.1 hypothetical protein CLV92_114113 [Kineococcus xinjiangensis]